MTTDTKTERKNAVVTGASRGLGRAVAERLAREGHRVLLVARGEEALHDVVEALVASGADAHALALDVAAPEAGATIAAVAHELLGPVDLLVNNASTLGPVPLVPLTETSDDAFERALAVNLSAPFRLTRAVVGAMVLRGEGTVVLVSSDAAVDAYPSWGAYGASKAGLDHLARIWAAELEGTGVRVLSVDPGEMDTRMHALALPDANRNTLARPEDVAGALLVRLVDAPSGTRIGGLS
ncbi:MAG: SDR family NAD(P)-dependent oxidoreductase [Sandaracinaceae bacterium]